MRNFDLAADGKRMVALMPVETPEARMICGTIHIDGFSAAGRSVRLRGQTGSALLLPQEI